MVGFFEWQGVVGTIAGVIGTVVSIFVWFKSRKIDKFLEKEKDRLAEQVKFDITDGLRTHEMPFLRRQEVTRGEVQGRIGTLPMKQKGSRYSIEYTNSLSFYKQLDEIIDGSHENGKSVLIITCTANEFDQFAFDSTQSKTVVGLSKTEGV